MRRAFRFLMLCSALCPLTVWAYSGPIHELFPERTLQGDPRLTQEVFPAVTPADLTAFRLWLDAQFREHPDEKVRAEYLRRFPTPAAFDVAAFKHLLMLNPVKQVNGFDKADGLPATGMKALQAAGSQPDSDERNRDRMARDDKGEPRTLPDGRAVVEDPVILNMGNATGLSSQAHAHYGLLDVAFSSDPDMLKTDPRRFALPFGWPQGPVKTFGKEMVQEHYDLAVLASLWNTPAGRSLSHLYLGQAFHYLGDLANQVHTVQVGSHDFFVQAKILTYERSLKTLGGYLGELRPFTSVGLEMLTAHHLLSEALNLKRVKEALEDKATSEPVKALLPSLGADDAEFKKDMEMAVAQAVAKGRKGAYAPLSTVVAARLIEYSSREGGEVYRHTAGAAAPRLQEIGAHFDDEKDDPDLALGDVSQPDVKAHLESLYWLQAKAFARVGTSFRMVHSLYRADTAVDSDAARAARAKLVAQSLLTARLAELAAGEQRLAAFLRDPPPAKERLVKDPAWLVGPPLVVLALAAALYRVLRRKPPEPQPDVTA